MRKNLVFAVLLLLLVMLVASLWVGAARTRAVATALLGRAEASASALGSAAARPPTSASAVAPLPSASAAPKPAGPRKLSVVGLGWDALAPGLLAAGGLHSQSDSAFAHAELDVSFSVASSMLEVEKSLASGSAAGGADLAALPLSELVAAYERLRALEPRVFFVSGWSQGRDRLSGPAPSKLPSSGSIGLEVSGGEDALAFALSILDLSGVALDRVKMGAKDASAQLRATSGDAAAPAGDSLTTRDAQHLLPYVLVAPRPLVEDSEPALALLAQGWLDGSASLLKDRPQAARKLGTFEKAPDALSLLQQLGNLEPILAYENAELLGLSGRGAVTIDALLDWQGRTRREAHAQQAPSFDTPLVDGRVVTRLVRENPKLAHAPEPPKRRASAGAAAVLLELPQRKEDDARLVEKLGLLAAVFPRCDLRLTTDASRAKLRGEVVERAATRYDLDRSRLLQASAALAAGRAALLEVVRAP